MSEKFKAMTNKFLEEFDLSWNNKFVYGDF